MSDDLELDLNDDSSLDSMLDDFGDDSMGDDPFAEKKKGVVSSVLAGAKETTVDTIKDPGKLASMAVEKAMPKEVQNIVNPVLRVKDSFKDTLRDSSKSLRSELKPIMSKLDQIVPEQGLLRKGFNYVKEVMAPDGEGSGSISLEKEAAAQAAALWQDGETDRIQNIIAQSLEHTRGLNALELQRSTLKEVSQFSQYTLQITSNYQRKSLELRYRMAAMFKNYLEIFKDYSKDTKRQLEAVVTNTSLPDFAKLKTTKALVQQVRADINRRLIDRLYGNTNYVDNIINNITNKVSSAVSSIGDAVGMVSGVGMDDDMGIDKRELAGGFAAEGAMGALMAAGRKRLERKRKDNGLLSKLDYFSRSMPDALEDYSRRSKDKGFIRSKLGSVAGWLADLARPPTKDIRMDRVNELSPEQIRNYDVRSKISLIEVIPGYLSRILREVTLLSRGEDTELLKYSFTSRAFVGESKITNFLKREIEEVSNVTGLSSELDRFTSLLEEAAGPMDNELREKFRAAVVKNAIEGDAVGLNSLGGRGFFEDFNEEETKKLKGILSTYVTSAKDKYDALAMFKEQMERVRSSVPDTTDVIKDAIDRGSSDSLIELGVLEPTMDGKVTLNTREIQRRLAQAGREDRDKDYEEYLRRREEEEQEKEQQANWIVGQASILRDKMMQKVNVKNVKKAADVAGGTISKYTPKPVKTVFNKLYGKDSLLQKGTKAAVNKTAGLIDATIKKENAIKNTVRGLFGKPKVKSKGPRLKARLRKLRGSTRGILKKVSSGMDANFAVISNLENEYGLFMEDIAKDIEAGPSEPFAVETSKNTAISNVYLDNIVNILKGLRDGDKKDKPKRFEDELKRLKDAAEAKKQRIKERLEKRKTKEGKDGESGKKGLLSGIPLIAGLITKTKDAVVGKLGFIGSVIESIAEVLGASYVGKKAMDLTGFGGEGKERKKINLRKEKTAKKVGRFAKLKGLAKGGLGKFGKLGIIGALGGMTMGAGSKLMEGAGGLKDKLFGMFGESTAKKETAKLAEKTTAKVAEKAAGKTAGKFLAKSALKKIPLVGALAGLGFGISRLMDGDLAGAGLEIASGLAGGSGLGFLASVGIDAYLAKRDLDKESEKATRALEPEIVKALETIKLERDSIDPTTVVDKLANATKALVKSGLTDEKDLSGLLVKHMGKTFKADKKLLKPIATFIAKKAILEVGTSNAVAFITPDIITAIEIILRGGKPEGSVDDLIKAKGKYSTNITDTRSRIAGRRRQRTTRDLPKFPRVNKGATTAAVSEMSFADDIESYANIKGADISGLNPAVKEQLTAMAKEYYELTGNKIQINSAARSKAEQRRLKAQLGRTAAKPGRSLHEYGLALDINTKDANALDQLGLMRKYGFTRPLQGETWHIEPAFLQFDLDGVRADPKLAAELTRQSMGYGGKGLGAITKKGEKPIRRDLSLAMEFITGGASDSPQTGLVPVSNKTVRQAGKLPAIQGDYIPAKEVKPIRQPKKPIEVSKTEPKLPPVNGEILNKEIPGVNGNLRSISSTLMDSLEVQREILVVLKEFKAMKEKAEKETSNNPPQPSMNTTIPEPAVSMGRMTRV